MLDIIECFEKRRSVRAFTDEPVPEDVIENALLMANQAPSAGNLQARDFVVVRDEGMRAKLADASPGHKFLMDAPVMIVCCANLDRVIEYGPRGKDLYAIQDVSASVENMLLYITARGYGGCWIGAFDERKVADTLGLPKHVRPLTLIPIGRPMREGTKPPRVKIELLVHNERW
ncbi:MAG: nitroreductase family protein [Methanomassiliicoccus sp.]|nr:nitroreductase family protein [Methanomassiliicoccus sp.]